MATKHIILYAEDDLDDLYIIRQAFSKYNNTIEIVHANNGFEAIEHLNELQNNNLSPCLIILDINMPGMDGREALTRIKQSDSYKTIPVVLFTTSSSTLDKEFATAWKADFITKPLMFHELEQLAKKFIDICGIEQSERA